MGWDPRGMRVLVTGASSGIGAETAVLLGGLGARVGICARRADRLHKTRDRCLEAGAPECAVWTVDLNDLDAIDTFGAQVSEEWGGVDALVNNAGASRRRAMDLITRGEWDETMRVNFWSSVRLVEAFLPGMLERHHGRICNVSSMGTRSGARNVGAYAAAKAALNHYTEALYLDLAGSGVHAQLFIPGSTSSEFSTDKAGNDPPTKQDPRSFMSPHDVAVALVEFLQGDAAEGFASNAHAALSSKKYADHDAWLREYPNMLERIGAGTRWQRDSSPSKENGGT
jgi:short-subunit dehydrogenase